MSMPVSTPQEPAYLPPQRPGRKGLRVRTPLEPEENRHLGAGCGQPSRSAKRSAGIDNHALGFVMGILWTIIIGFLAGVIAKFLMPGPNEPAGFILTTILGIVGAFVATFLGQAVGWYGPNQGAGFIGAIVGAVVVLFIYGLIAGRRTTTY
jgi:uncharacterized membrane protein YeaQ/YmgE (transglycosylase-associated protein family)